MKKVCSVSALLGFLFLALVPVSCWYDNEEALYGGDLGCDTVNVRYSVEVRGIMQNNCYSCHSTSSNVSGFPFDDYAGLKAYAENGGLVGRMNDQLSPMPPTGLLSACDRAKIEAWVKAGAPEN
ncbi:MAG: hypothetical protein IPL65_02510 [Lewinellaceae bacterium]|nr:hypothetical protein [Lewinellaceae bacterium]